MTRFDAYLLEATTAGNDAMIGGEHTRADLLVLAQLNATLAAADALNRIADCLEFQQDHTHA